MANHSTFYFAWVNSTETTFGSEHQREDELIFSFKLTHDEGQFATLELEIINPHIGLLALGRPFWGWFSFSDGTTITPLFFGRLVGVPSNLFADVITITLVAKPVDYTEQRLAIAAGLRVLPFFDPIFIDVKQREDPDVALEGYSALYHVDRVSHLVTISDVIAGEDGIAEFTPNDAFYDSVKVELGEAPLMVCEIDATVTWVQCEHTGVLQFQKQQLTPLSSAVGDALSVQNQDLGNGFKTIKTLNANGHTVTSANNNPNTINITWSYENQAETHSDGDTMSVNGNLTYTGLPGTIASMGSAIAAGQKGGVSGDGTYEFQRTMVIGDPYTGRGAEGSVTVKWTQPVNIVTAALEQPVATDLEIATELEQNRTEVIHVRVLADVQPVFTEATETENNIKETLSMQASDVVAEGAATPSDGVYFPTARGLQSLEYLLMVARAHLLARSRVVKVSWDCKFNDIIGLSCRKNATLEDSRLPGGSVLGKVVSYGMTGAGDSGEFLGNVTISSAIGYGNPIVLADGTPDYVDTDYVNPGYQHYSGTLVAATTNDMAFSPLAYEAAGIQLPISADQVLVRHEWIDSGQATAAQAAYDSAIAAARQLGSFTESAEIGGMTGPSPELMAYAAARATMFSGVDQAIRDNPAWLELELKPVQGISTNVEYDADISPLMIPMQIDLSAGSIP